MHPLDTVGAAAVLDVEATASTTDSSARDDNNTSRSNNGVTNHSRRRSRSEASGQPSVETVIVKAKRAASSLWMLLHAQNCVVAAGKCRHSSCHEAKLLHLHLKTCPAGTGFECPTHHKGCDQARQLLAHYRRCRSIRARQAGLHPSRRDPQQQHVCLVCSLVARQAKTMLEGKSSGAQSRPIKPIPPRKPSTGRQPAVSFSLTTKENEILPCMPPPPPRRLNWCKESDGSTASSCSSSSNSMGPPGALVQQACSIDSARVSFMPPQPQDSTARSAGRERSVSVVDEKPKAIQRTRSVSLGSKPVQLQTNGSCDTIEEEELQENNAKEGIDFEFNIDIARGGA